MRGTISHRNLISAVVRTSKAGPGVNLSRSPALSFLIIQPKNNCQGWRSFSFPQAPEIPNYSCAIHKMLKFSSQVFRSPHSVLYNRPWTCLSCLLQSTTKPQPRQWPPYRRQQYSDNNGPSLKKQHPTPTEPPKEEKKDDRDDKGVKGLKRLSRPLGQPVPPQPGENCGIDSRSLAQRCDDFFNNDKREARREEM